MLVFLGDSITEWWDKEVYKRDYSKYQNLNLGVAGHQTPDLLKIVNGDNFRNSNPKLVVLMIGVNDINGGIKYDVLAENIKHIIERIFSIFPNVKILLRGILPSQKYKSNRVRIVTKEVNNIISKYKNNSNIFYIDNTALFLNPDDSLREDLFPDLLHLSKEGYEVLSKGLTPKINKLMN